MGLVKNMALMAYITVGSHPGPILEFLEEWSMENLEEISPANILGYVQFYSLLLRACVCVWGGGVGWGGGGVTMERMCHTNGKHDKRHKQYLSIYAKIEQQQEPSQLRSWQKEREAICQTKHFTVVFFQDLNCD